MIDTPHWLRQGQAVGSRVRDTIRRRHGRPDCPRCGTARAVTIVRIEIDELPGLHLIEHRDWTCHTCHSLVRETVTPEA